MRPGQGRYLSPSLLPPSADRTWGRGRRSEKASSPGRLRREETGQARGSGLELDPRGAGFALVGEQGPGKREPASQPVALTSTRHVGESVRVERRLGAS